ncbi:MAG: glycoside hydrolase family 130 protein [Candidatus Methanospirareceae archaeon]
MYVLLIGMFKIVSEQNKRVKEVRENKTVDIVERKGVITADKVHLRYYPADNPIAIFNPSIIIEDKEATIYGRIILGYFTYASAIAEFKIPMDDIQNGLLTGVHYTAEITVIPDNKYDLWGVEDPRVYIIEGGRYMSYCGRTVNYFNPSTRADRTLPVTAVLRDGKWEKICVFRLKGEYRNFLISDKDAFLANIGGLRVFHRPHMMNEKFYLVVSRVPEEALKHEGLREVPVYDTALVFEQATFENRIGWGAPPIKVGDEYLFLLHGIEREMESYRVFAVLMNEEMEVTAVTPHYIMEPKANYEVYGDRPFVVFPCGAQLMDNEIIISYGAADSSIGIGSINLDQLLAILDSNRL